MNNKYTAHINLRQEEKEIVLYFNNLSRKDAEAIHRVMDKHYSHITSSADVRSYGWEEQK
jgi:hypothetical protein